MRRLIWLGSVFVISLGISIAVEVVEPSRITDWKIDKVPFDLRALRSALELYYLDNSRYPSEAEGGLLQLINGSETKYLDRLPIDPWGSSYVYRLADPNSFNIYSIGKNSIDELGERDDVTEFEKTYKCEDYPSYCPLEPIVYLRIGSLLTLLLSFVLSIIMGLDIGIRFLYRKLAT